MSLSSRPSLPSSSSSSSAASGKTLKSPVIPSRQESLATSPPSPILPTPPSSLSPSFETSATLDDAIVGSGSVYSLGQVGDRIEREGRLKNKGSSDEERELEEFLQEIGEGFDGGDFRLGGGARTPLGGEPAKSYPKKDKLLVVLGLPLPPTPSSASTSSPPSPHSSQTPHYPPPASLPRRPSSPLQSTTKLPSPTVRRPSLPPLPPTAKGVPLAPAKPPQGFGHSRRTSLNLGFGININLGGNSTASLASPTGTASPTSLYPPISPKVPQSSGFQSDSSTLSSTPSHSASTRSTSNGPSSLSSSMSNFAFGASSASSSHPKPRRGLASSNSSLSLREDPLSNGGGLAAPAKVGKSGSKRDLAGFLGRRRGEGEGHAMGRSVSSSGADVRGHREKSPSVFPLQFLLKQTFTSSSSTATTSQVSLQPPSPKAEAWTPPLLVLPSPTSSLSTSSPEHPSRTPTPTQATGPPSTHLLASALRIERLLALHPSVLALEAADPSHEFFLAEPVLPASPSPFCSSLSFPTFAPYSHSPHNATAPSSATTLDDADWIEEWIRTGVGRPSEEISRRVRAERRRVPLWKGPSANSTSSRKISPCSRSSSTSTNNLASAGTAGGAEGESSSEESGALQTPSTSSPSFEQSQAEVETGASGMWEDARKLRSKRLGSGGSAVGVEEELGWKEDALKGAGGGKKSGAGLMEKVRINLVPASPNGPRF